MSLRGLGFLGAHSEWAVGFQKYVLVIHSRVLPRQENKLLRILNFLLCNISNMQKGKVINIIITHPLDIIIVNILHFFCYFLF